MTRTDKELLDFLQELTDRKVFTGKVMLRSSITGRGWRLHETNLGGATSNVRTAIAEAMERYYKSNEKHF